MAIAPIPFANRAVEEDEKARDLASADGSAAGPIASLAGATVQGTKDLADVAMTPTFEVGDKLAEISARGAPEAPAAAAPAPVVTPPEQPAGVVPPGQAPAGPVKVKTGETTTTSTKVVSDAEKKHLADTEAAYEAKAKLEEQAGNNAAAVAQAEADKANALAEAKAEKQRQVAEVARIANEKIRAKQEAWEKADAAARATKFKEIRWADQTTGQKVLDGIAMFVGLFGAGAGADIPGVIQSRLDRENAAQKDAIERQYKDADRLRVGIEDAKAAKVDALTDADRNHANILDKVASQWEAASAKARLPGAKDAALKEAADTRLKAKEIRQKVFEQTRSEVVKQAQFQMTMGGAGAGADGQGKATTEDLKEVARVNDQVAGIKRLLKDLSNDPKAWDEYQSAVGGWQKNEAGAKDSPPLKWARGLGKAAGIADTTPGQSIKNPVARRIMTEIEALTTGMGKGLGGALTEADAERIKAQLGATGNNAQQMIAVLMNVANDLEQKRNLFLQNKAIAGQVPTQGGPVTGGAADPQKDEAIKWAQANLTGPKAAQAKAILTAHGYKVQ